MDCKIIKFFLLIFFISFKSYAVEFNGKFIQGHYIIGKAEPNSSVIIDNRKVNVELTKKGKTYSLKSGVKKKKSGFKKKKFR